MTAGPGLDLLEVATGGPARAAFTTRAGGVSAGPLASLNLAADRGDRDAAVRENRRRVCAALGLRPEAVAMARQVHGAGVRDADADDADRGRFLGALRGWRDGDALVTRAPGGALAVLGADCLPVLLWRRDAPAVAAAHAGWRGLVGGVLEAAVAALGAPARVGAAIGPGIGPCCYPVSAEVRRRFAARFGDAVVAPPAVDLAAAARRALVAAGVPDAAVTTAAACTSCEPGRFFSHRRDGAATGRQAGVIALAEEVG
ncbi:polyphenol oxidase family protein [Miltoncostaea marina]|uniref:polyphenol oxidase family protein n=1 Tax=Miltoncostaea marina TaxID=2843215 RepID=UPI001C3E148B|nr:polyphenol oxidase family protein [Miltoncostaea marina]